MKEGLKELKNRMIASGWGRVPQGQYPRPHVADWVSVAHPEILAEYKLWYDQEVRGIVEAEELGTISGETPATIRKGKHNA